MAVQRTLSSRGRASPETSRNRRPGQVAGPAVARRVGTQQCAVMPALAEELGPAPGQEAGAPRAWKPAWPRPVHDTQISSIEKSKAIVMPWCTRSSGGLRRYPRPPGRSCRCWRAPRRRPWPAGGAGGVGDVGRRARAASPPRPPPVRRFPLLGADPALLSSRHMTGGRHRRATRPRWEDRVRVSRTSASLGVRASLSSGNPTSSGT